MTRKVWTRTFTLGAPGSFQRCVNQSRKPAFAPSLPIVEGAGGWPVEEPTQGELAKFLEGLRTNPPEPFMAYPAGSPDYGTIFSYALSVRQWLEVVDEFKLLVPGDYNGHTP